MIGKAVHARLKAHAGTAALVVDRIYPLRLPPSPTYPAVRYQVITDPQTHLMGADLNELHAQVQIDCYAVTYPGAHALKTQVKAALSRWEGTAGGVTVIHSFYDDSRDLEETIEQGIYRVMMDFTMHWQE